MVWNTCSWGYNPLSEASNVSQKYSDICYYGSILLRTIYLMIEHELFITVSNKRIQ